MELQIKDLVDSIKKDGIEKAKEEALAIISDAENKAKAILDKADSDASMILREASEKVEVFNESARVGAKQAQRDAVLSFKKEIQSILENILKKNIAKTMDSDALGKLISACIADEDVSKLSVEVSSVSESLKAQLADEIKNGLVIRPVKDIKAGFRVNMNDNSGFFDCTDEEIAKMLSVFFGDLTI